ncbi:MFS transporter [Aldersonia sp. NBC_00410]|uniref:MFS transporter n=1 Tax=Aldersonia sp. NBC_00410 TaxID=2975954 RepID=UPI002250E61B|nr:MFS transporter [Aldersonia sp. NBC_00410]MCX5043579.1 MFS transporter [Aldersonia sp. NBC_00410]
MSPAAMRPGTAFACLVYAFTVVMLGTTLPTPMYALYAEELNFSTLVTTVIFATYAAGVLVALIGFGRWSDTLGRKPLLLAGALFAVASALVFVTAGPVSQLLIGRFLSGLSAGIYAGTATAAVIEAAPESWRARAPAVATAANMGGLGLGPLLAGILVEYAAWPLHLAFLVHIVLLVVLLAGVTFVPETVNVVPGARPAMQRLAVPAAIRPLFIRAAIAAFAGFAVFGLFTSVAPSFLAQIIGVSNHAVAGLIVFSVFAASAVAQIAGRGLATNTALIAGCALLVVGTLVIAAALLTESLPVLVVAALVVGVGQGISFSKGLGGIAAATPIAHRAEVTSTYFVVAYIAISVPVIGEGFGAEQWGLRTAGIVFTLLVAALALIALIATVLAARRAHTAVDTSVVE